MTPGLPLKPPHYAQLVACLIDQPYCLRPWEIARLTDSQIYDLYFRPREETGVPKPLPEPEAYQKKMFPTPAELAVEKAQFLDMSLKMMRFKALKNKDGQLIEDVKQLEDIWEQNLIKRMQAEIDGK